LISSRGGVLATVSVKSALVLAVLGLGFVAPAGAFALTHPSPVRVTAGQPVPALRLGSRGPAVRSLQATLARLTYLPSAGVDGVFGMQTWHAVVAFQGWSSLTRDGIVGARTRGALARAHPPTPWSTVSGFEIHIAQQVLLVITDRRVIRAIHVSTGAGGATPLGHFRIYRRDPMSWSAPFHVWMPLAQYFSGGYAMHEFASVPAYPASHGCVRVPATESRLVWRFGRIAMRVWTRP
jgi:peptidoglycan hydrolase-like protein with peptidoglycan-binding domain